MHSVLNSIKGLESKKKKTEDILDILIWQMKI